MWRIAVTFKALTVASSRHSLIGHAGTVAEEGGVAAKAILLNYLFPGFPDVNGLGFPAQGEDC